MTLRLLCTAAVAVWILAGCDPGPSGPSEPPRLTISPETATLYAGEEEVFTVTLWDAEGTRRVATDAIWKNLDIGIVSLVGQGRIRAIVPGVARLTVSAGGATDTVTVTVRRTPVYIRVSPHPFPVIAPGDTFRLTARLYDAQGSEILGHPVSWESTNTSVATVDSTGLLTAHRYGAVNVNARARAAFAWTYGVIRGPECGDSVPAITLRRGEIRTFAGVSSLCLAGMAEYGIIVHHSATVGTLSLDIAASGGLRTTAPASASVASASPLTARSGAFSRPRLYRDRTFEAGLRLRERQQLGTRMRHVQMPRLSRSLAAEPVQVGARLRLNTSTSCSKQNLRTGRVAAVTQHAIVVADTANPAGGPSDAEYQSFGVSFDTLVYGLSTRTFGQVTDLDANGRVVIFFTRAVNELTPSGSDAYTSGYMWAGDLFPRSECASSNFGEMFYMLAADPNGEVNGNRRSMEFVQRTAVVTMAHEFQHLINAARRIHVNNASSFEEVWLNEGLSHIAEELVFYRASGLAPGQNIDISRVQSSPRILDAANHYLIDNLFLLSAYLRDTESQSAFQNDDDLPTRGAIWQFLRYAADRRGGDQDSFWNRLVNTTATGRTNLQSVLGVDLDRWIDDAQVGQWLDLPTSAPLTKDARFKHPSWDYLSLLSALNKGGYPLQARPLQRGSDYRLSLSPAGTAYLHGMVEPGQSAEIRFTSGAAAPPQTAWVTVVGLH